MIYLLYHVRTEALHVVRHPAEFLPPPALVINQLLHFPNQNGQVLDVYIRCEEKSSTCRLQIILLQHRQVSLVVRCNHGLICQHLSGTFLACQAGSWSVFVGCSFRKR